MKHRKPAQRAERLKARRAQFDKVGRTAHKHHRPGSQNPHKGDGSSRSKAHR